MSDKYILRGHEPVPVDDVLTWARNFENDGNRRVAETAIGDVRVSTVFLGIDHSFGQGGPPLLFETMVFGGPLDEEQDRCSTWEQAEKMHADMCDRVSASDKP